MDKNLSILHKAISNCGYWSWWNQNDDSTLQIEFSGVQILLDKAQKEKVPSSRLSLIFKKPISIHFLTMDNNTPENWHELLHNDSFDLKTINEDEFTFNDINLIQEIINNTVKSKSIIGNKLEYLDNYKNKQQLIFIAYNIGVYVVAEEMELFTDQGIITLNELEELNDNWWNYWKDYWKCKDTKTPYQYDYTCECIQPL